MVIVVATVDKKRIRYKVITAICNKIYYINLITGARNFRSHGLKYIIIQYYKIN